MSTPTGRPTVLIIGATSGLGFAVAQELAASGGYPVIVGARTRAKADDARSRLLAEAQSPVNEAAVAGVPIEHGW